jgi:hypothetical protein
MAASCAVPVVPSLEAWTTACRNIKLTVEKVGKLALELLRIFCALVHYSSILEKTRASKYSFFLFSQSLDILPPKLSFSATVATVCFSPVASGTVLSWSIDASPTWYLSYPRIDSLSFARRKIGTDFRWNSETFPSIITLPFAQQPQQCCLAAE